MTKDQLKELAISLGIDLLDDEVHDVASEIASGVNNEGLDGQIDWLCDQLGAAEVERLLRNIHGGLT